MIRKKNRMKPVTTVMMALIGLVTVVTVFFPVHADNLKEPVVEQGWPTEPDSLEVDTIAVDAIETDSVAVETDSVAVEPDEGFDHVEFSDTLNLGMVAKSLKTCPLSPLDILTPQARLKLIGGYLNNKTDEKMVLNSVYALSEIDTLTDDYLKLRLTAVSTVTINKIERKKKPVLMTVYTIGGVGRAADSDIEFFDTEWKPLKTKELWQAPKVKDFLVKGESTDVDLDEIAHLIPFPTYELTPSPDGLTVTVCLTVGEFLSEEAKESLKPYLVRDREWVWTGKKFERKKEK